MVFKKEIIRTANREEGSEGEAIGRSLDVFSRDSSCSFPEGRELSPEDPSVPFCEKDNSKSAQLE